MASNYSTSGSDNCEKIRELTLKQMDLQSKAIALQRNTELGIAKANDSLQSLINAYKEDVKLNYIYKEPMKAYAYFALFQAIGNYLIFNPRTTGMTSRHSLPLPPAGTPIFHMPSADRTFTTSPSKA